MKMNVTDRFVSAVDDVTHMNKMSISQGEYDATLRRLHNRTDSVGVIRNVLIQGSTLYVVAYRTKNLYHQNDEHAAVEYYNAHGGEIENYSFHELFMPVINIDLSRDIVDPRKFIGGKVLVTEIDNIPVKTEFIGQLDEINESPVKIARTVLRSIRNFIGPSTPLNDKSDLTENIIRGFGVNPSDMDKLMSLNIENTKDGDVFSFQGEGVFSQDTSEPPEGIIVVKSIGDLTRRLQNNPMKSKKCHLPVKIFSAR